MYKGSERRQCFGKIKHRTPAQAKAAIKRMGNSRKGRLNVYKCPWCHMFHVGRVPNRNGTKT